MNSILLQTVIAEERSQVLKGCVILLSGIVPMNVNLETSPVYQLAKQFGAKVVFFNFQRRAVVLKLHSFFFYNLEKGNHFYWMRNFSSNLFQIASEFSDDVTHVIGAKWGTRWVEFHGYFKKWFRIGSNFEFP